MGDGLKFDDDGPTAEALRNSKAAQLQPGQYTSGQRGRGMADQSERWHDLPLSDQAMAPEDRARAALHQPMPATHGEIVRRVTKAIREAEMSVHAGYRLTQDDWLRAQGLR